MASSKDDQKKIDVELSTSESEKLARTAKQLNMPPEEIARLALSDLLTQSIDDVRRVTEYLKLKKQAQERHPTE